MKKRKYQVGIEHKYLKPECYDHIRYVHFMFG